MDNILYSIPVSALNEYRERHVVVRAATLADIAEALRGADLQFVPYVQLLKIPDEVCWPAEWDLPLPVDVVMTNVEEEYPKLYQCSALLAASPVRVSIPVVPGFGKAVKLAVSLGFAVVLEVTQPDAVLVRDLHRALDLYLHHPDLCRPVEFFHSLLLACYQAAPASLWAIQEEDPAQFRYVTDEGRQILSRRLAALDPAGDYDTFLERFMAELLEQKAECGDCEYLGICGGYFKWPDRGYACEGIKSLFREIRSAAEELKRDNAMFESSQETERP